MAADLLCKLKVVYKYYNVTSSKHRNYYTFRSVFDVDLTLIQLFIAQQVISIKVAYNLSYYDYFNVLSLAVLVDSSYVYRLRCLLIELSACIIVLAAYCNRRYFSGYIRKFFKEATQNEIPSNTSVKANVEAFFTINYRAYLKA